MGNYLEEEREFIEHVVSGCASMLQGLSLPTSLILFNEIYSVDRKRNEREEPVVLGGSGTDIQQALDFRKFLRRLLQKGGFGSLIRGDVPPHMTLSYSRRNLIPLQESQTVSWNVDRLVLIESVIGKNQHVERGCWLLHETHASVELD